MNFHEIFFGQSDGDVLLIQPNMLQQTKPEHIDPIQTEYWKSCESVGSLFGDLPIEPNWGLLSISTSLKQNGYKVAHIDFNLYDYIKVKKTNEFITLTDIRHVLLRKRYRVIGISCMTVSHNNTLEIARICKEINPECIVLVGGIHFSFIPEMALISQYIDGVLCGEGEESFVQFMKYCNEQQKWTNVSGLVYRKEGDIVKNPVKQLGTLEDIGRPDYESWPSDVPLIPRIYMSRGCNGGCDYCVVNQFFCEAYRKRPLEKVIEEIEYVVSELGCKDILIGDLNFAASKEDALRLCEHIVNKQLKIQWWCQTRADGLDEELIKAMKAAGCVQIGIGIESVDKEILENSCSTKENRQLSTKELCQLIRKYDIEVQGYFIIGLPGETFTSAMNTIKWIDELTCNDYVNITHIAVLVPYPGTPIFLNPEQYKMKIINSDFSKYIMNCDYMNTGVPIIETEELNNFQIYALWQLALSTASKNFRKKSKKNVPEMFNALYEFWNEITFYE